MIDKLLAKIKKLIPKTLFKWLQPGYHCLLSFIAPIIYGHPSNKLIVIGITGTKGKSTTCYLLSRILETAGYKVGMSSGIIMKVGDKEWLNDYKMTMPGRLQQQKLLSDTVKAGCRYVIIETTSEGIKQYRHSGINYDVALFTNLYPEHIESHGSFENYREAKGKLFYHLTRRPRKEFFPNKISIVNQDDKNSDFFAFFPADKKYAFSIYDNKSATHFEGSELIKASHIRLNNSGISFSVKDTNFEINLLGEMNAYNALAAISAAKALGVKDQTIVAVLDKIKVIPGRVEFIEEGQEYKIIVDYAHDPESLRQLFSVIHMLKLVEPKADVIHVFGAPGGGRDKAKRAVMGGISDQNADVIILTNDDPYEEKAEGIIEQICQGIGPTKKLIKKTDRSEAIKIALGLAKAGDLVLITGKGSEQAIMLKDGRHKWDDRQVVRDLLNG